MSTVDWSSQSAAALLVNDPADEQGNKCTITFIDPQFLLFRTAFKIFFSKEVDLDEVVRICGSCEELGHISTANFI